MPKSSKDRGRERKDESDRDDYVSDGEYDSNRPIIEEMDSKSSRKLLCRSEHSIKNKNKKKHSAQSSDA